MTTFWICAAVSYFADDVTTVCAHCHTAVVHRPYAPAHSIKICARCSAAVLKDPAARIGVNRQTVEEAALYFAKTKGTQ